MTIYSSNSIAYEAWLLSFPKYSKISVLNQQKLKASVAHLKQTLEPMKLKISEPFEQQSKQNKHNVQSLESKQQSNSNE